MAQPDYSVPNWIHGANPLQSITTGAELGVRIAESNQRAAIAYAELQRRQQEFQQTMEMHQQQLEQEQAFQQQRLQAQQQIQEQNQMRDDQKLMIENAYRQGQLGLQKQKLELTAQAAAQKMQAQEKFLFDRETIKNSLIYEEGMDPDEAERRATIQSMFRNATAIGISPSALAGLAKSVSPQREAQIVDITTDRGTYKAIQNPSGAQTIFERPERDKVPEPRFSVTPPDPTDPQSQAKVSRISGVTPQQLRQFGVTNVGKYVAPEASVTAQAEKPTPKFGAPQKGQVISGYEFQGGDPGDEKNWKPVNESEE